MLAIVKFLGAVLLRLTVSFAIGALTFYAIWCSGWNKGFNLGYQAGIVDVYLGLIKPEDFVKKPKVPYE